MIQSAEGTRCEFCGDHFWQSQEVEPGGLVVCGDCFETYGAVLMLATRNSGSYILETANGSQFTFVRAELYGPWVTLCGATNLDANLHSRPITLRAEAIEWVARLSE